MNNNNQQNAGQANPPSSPPLQFQKPVMFLKKDIDKYGFKPLTPIRNDPQVPGKDIVIRTKQAAANVLGQGNGGQGNGGHGHG